MGKKALRIDLHCNLPFTELMPNPALGYLKGFIEKDCDVRAIYWNLLLSRMGYKDILKKTSALLGQEGPSGAGSVSTYLSEGLFMAYLCRYLYSNDVDPVPLFDKIAGINTPPHKLKDLIQGIKEFIDEYIRREELFSVDAAGFTMKTDQWLLNYYILLRLKHRNPSIKTIIGGLRNVSSALEFMRTFKEADFAIYGEGEIPLLRLAKSFDDPSAFNTIPNLLYRKDDEILSNPPLPPEALGDINQYPFADHTDYFKTVKECKLDSLIPSCCIPIWGVRSCSWNRCKFCVLNEELPYRERTPENIVSEIEYQSRKHGIDRIQFVDTDIGRKSRDEFDKLLELLIESSVRCGRPYHMYGDISPLRLDGRSIEAMRKIKFETVQVGFEASSNSLLRKMRKKHSFAHNIQALKLGEEHHFDMVGLNIIQGIPSETEGDVVESILNLKFLRFFLRTYHLRPCRLTLYKGAPFFDEMPEEQMGNWDQNILGQEARYLDFLSAADKYEFGFLRNGRPNDLLWDTFVRLLGYYQSNECSYEWFKYPNGSSIIEEKFSDGEKIYNLDPTDTEILIFCDEVKKLSKLKSHFKDLEGEELGRTISSLKEVGLLYFDADEEMFVSTVSPGHIVRIGGS